MSTRLAEIRELTRARLLVFRREPEAVFWVYAFPLILAVALGLAFRDKGVESERVGVVASASSARWLEILEDAEHLDGELAKSLDEGNRWLRNGRVAVLLTGDEDEDGDEEKLRLRYDPARPESDTARLRLEDAVQRAAGREDRVPVVRQHVTETGSRYIDWLIPGLLGMNLMGTGIWGIGFTIVNARQKKLLKRFLVTPMRRSSYLLGFILSRLVFLFFEIVILLGFAFLVIGVPMRGSFLALAAVCLVGACGFSGIGLFIAARPRTVEGASGIMNLVMMPMWLCSGVFFSYEKFPEWLHPYLEALPLTAVNNGLRGAILDGSGLMDLGLELAIPALWGVACFGIALKIFRWR